MANFSSGLMIFVEVRPWMDGSFAAFPAEQTAVCKMMSSNGTKEEEELPPGAGIPPKSRTIRTIDGSGC